MKSDFKSDVLKKLEPAPKNHKKGKWLWILPLQKGEKKEEKVTTVISSLLRVKSEGVKLLLKGKLELTTLWFLSSRSFANESVIDENFEQKIK